MSQLAIDLPFRPALGAADFLVSACNRAALERIERWPDWPERGLVLYGPAQCGKSHLALLWSGRAGGRLVPGPALGTLSPPQLAALPAVAIDDAETAPERALLHLHNCCRETGAGLLIVARQPPARWPIALPDLASRLRAMPAVGIGPPDDALLAGLLIKHFTDRQIRVAPAAINFAVRRIERSFAAAAAFVTALDRAALGAGRPIGLALMRRVLAETGAQPDVRAERRSDFGVT
jgi:chromosomal replication initiation ATPase DnaA